MNPWNQKEERMPEITATLKYGKGYEAAWLVIKGETPEAVHGAVAEATGLDGEGLTLSELVQNASKHVQLLGTTGTILGGTAIPKSEDKPNEAPKQEEPKAEAPKEESKPDPTAELLEKVKGLKDKKELTSLYLANKAAFDSTPELMEALKAAV